MTRLGVPAPSVIGSPISYPVSGVYMRTLLLSSCALMLGTALTAQSSNTLPKGWDSKDGTENFGSMNNSSIWDGWRPSTTYTPARVLYLYDQATFAWGANSKAITKLSVRRDAAAPAGATAAHTKEIAIYVSTTNQRANAPDFRYDGNHGANRRLVFRKKKVNFPATAKPGSGAAPFNIGMTFDSAFVVPPRTTTLAIEMRVYSGTVATGDWQTDSVTHSSTGWNPGSTSTALYSKHCVSPSITYSSIDTWPGGTFLHIWNTRGAAGRPLVAFLGLPFAKGIPIPGTGSTTLPQCEWWVNPLIFTATLTRADGSAFFGFGKLPDDSKLTGIKVYHQAALFDPKLNTAGLALTRAITETIGAGYDIKNCQISAIYASGTSRTRRVDKKPFDPDKEEYCRFYFRRVPVFKVN